MTQQLHSWSFIKRSEKLCSHKNLHVNVYRNFIHNSKRTGNNADVLKLVNGQTGTPYLNTTQQ